MTWWGRGLHLQQIREGRVGEGAPDRMTVVANLEWKKWRWVRVRLPCGDGVVQVEMGRRPAPGAC